MGIFPDSPESREMWKKFEEERILRQKQMVKIVKHFNPKPYDYKKYDNAFLYEITGSLGERTIYYNAIDLFTASVKDMKFSTTEEMIDEIVDRYDVKYRDKEFVREHGFMTTDDVFYTSDEIFKALAKHVEKLTANPLLRLKFWK